MATQITTPSPSTPLGGGSILEKLTQATSGVAASLSIPSTPAPTTDYGTPTPESAEAPITDKVAPAVPDKVAASPQVDSPVIDKQTSGPVIETAQVQEDAKTNKYDDPGFDVDIPQTTLDAVMQQPRGREIVQGYKVLGELAKPLDKGGIGHIPTIEQARNYYLAHRDQRLMENDLNSANPQQVGRFLNHIFNDQRPKEAQVAIASSLVPALANNPELYAIVMEPFLEQYRESVMERLKETRGYKDNVADEEADALWFAAQILNKDLKGEYLKPDTAPQNGTVVTTGPDPLARERQELATQRAEIDRFRQQQSQQQQASWMNAYNQNVGQSLYNEIDAALEPLKEVYKNAPSMFAAARRQLHDEVVAGVTGNRHAMELHGVTMNDSFRAGSLQSAQDAAKQYINMATQVLRQRRRAFLEGAGLSSQRQIEQRHSEAAAVDANRGVGNGSGGHPGPVQSAPVTKGDKETQADFVSRMVKAATSKATRGMLRK